MNMTAYGYLKPEQTIWILSILESITLFGAAYYNIEQFFA